MAALYEDIETNIALAASPINMVSVQMFVNLVAKHQIHIATFQVNNQELFDQLWSVLIHKQRQVFMSVEIFKWLGCDSATSRQNFVRSLRYMELLGKIHITECHDDDARLQKYPEAVAEMADMDAATRSSSTWVLLDWIDFRTVLKQQIYTRNGRIVNRIFERMMALLKLYAAYTRAFRARRTDRILSVMVELTESDDDIEEDGDNADPTVVITM